MIETGADAIYLGLAIGCFIGGIMFFGSILMDHLKWLRDVKEAREDDDERTP